MRYRPPISKQRPQGGGTAHFGKHCFKAFTLSSNNNNNNNNNSEYYCIIIEIGIYALKLDNIFYMFINRANIFYSLDSNSNILVNYYYLRRFKFCPGVN